MNCTKKKKKKSKLQRNKENPNSGYWMRQCDRVFGLIYHSVHTKNFCVVGRYEPKADPCSGYIEMAHLIPKENYLWRWNLDNVIDACSNHHKLSRIISSHNSPIAFGQFLEKYFPDKYEFVNTHKWESITRKAELPFTFEEKYLELLNTALELKLLND